MLNIIVTLKSGLEVTQGHSNWYHRKLGYGFLFQVYSDYAMAVSLPVLRYTASKNGVTLKTGFGVVQGRPN